MRKPHAIIDLLSDHSQVVIDLFEIADLTACTEYENPDTGEIVRLDKEHCQILMNDGNGTIMIPTPTPTFEKYSRNIDQDFPISVVFITILIKYNCHLINFH